MWQVLAGGGRKNGTLRVWTYRYRSLSILISGSLQTAKTHLFLRETAISPAVWHGKLLCSARPFSWHRRAVFWHETVHKRQAP